ncbi:uncharacterized protein BDV17DRAFT_95522 [Aspergillus undulatus]|uniref:uncharacterized protein n=1 Tax=Aspergillus undulatus TaxID=1810928 RepID=UPI003CCE22AB
MSWPRQLPDYQTRWTDRMSTHRLPRREDLFFASCFAFSNRCSSTGAGDRSQITAKNRRWKKVVCWRWGRRWLSPHFPKGIASSGAAASFAKTLRKGSGMAYRLPIWW